VKYGKLRWFAESLPAIRRRVERDLALSGLCRDKILATIVRLLDTTFIRVGNDVYARENQSFGLTTMRDRHVSVAGSTIQFSFRGKSGIHHVVKLDDRHLARIIRQSRNLPGYELFQYLDSDGRRRSVRASDVNDYLQRMVGQDITAKDFRTWAGTVLAVQYLQSLPPPKSPKEAKRNVVRAIESVAGHLRNTKTVCRTCYIHPTVLESYLEGSVVTGWRIKSHGGHRRLLSRDESMVLQLLSTGPPSGLRKAA
jgi:DNA topoisomerase-1